MVHGLRGRSWGDRGVWEMVDSLQLSTSLPTVNGFIGRLRVLVRATFALNCLQQDLGYTNCIFCKLSRRALLGSRNYSVRATNRLMGSHVASGTHALRGALVHFVSLFHVCRWFF